MYELFVFGVNPYGIEFLFDEVFNSLYIVVCNLLNIFYT